MKKTLALSLLLILGFISGCAEDDVLGNSAGTIELNNDLPYITVSVEMEYSVDGSKTATPKLPGDIDIKDHVLYSKKDQNKTFDYLVGGDKVEIYYKDETKSQINHVLVDEAASLIVSTAISPCTTEVSIYSPHISNVILHYTNIWCMVNENGKYTGLADKPFNEGLYATYRDDLDSMDSNGYSHIEILALYSYLPR